MDMAEQECVSTGEVEVLHEPELAAEKPKGFSADELRQEFQLMVELAGAFGAAGTTRNQVLINQAQGTMVEKMRQVLSALLERGVEVEAEG